MSNQQMIIEFPKSVQAVVEKHCFSDIAVEQGGFLVGTLTDKGPKIKAAIPSLKAVSGQTKLTIGHDAWEEAHAKIDADYPDMHIVGWFHSHPGFGLFLSEYDAFIQQNFFSDSRQVALVVDPLAGELGWFVARDGEIVELYKKPTHMTAASRKGEAKAESVARQQPSERRGAVEFGPHAARIVAAAATVLIVTNVISWSVGSSRGRASADEFYGMSGFQSQMQVQQLQMSTMNLEQRVSDLRNGIARQDTTQAGLLYTVQANDTWESIASVYYDSADVVEQVMAANPKIDPEKALAPGTVLFLPDELPEVVVPEPSVMPSQPVESPQPSASPSKGA